MHHLGKLSFVLKNTLQWNSDCMLQNHENQNMSVTQNTLSHVDLWHDSVGLGGLALFIVPHGKMCWKSCRVKSVCSSQLAPTEKFTHSLLSFQSVPKNCLNSLFVTGLNLGNMQYIVSDV